MPYIYIYIEPADPKATCYMSEQDPPTMNKILQSPADSESLEDRMEEVKLLEYFKNMTGTSAPNPIFVPHPLDLCMIDTRNVAIQIEQLIARQTPPHVILGLIEKMTELGKTLHQHLRYVSPVPPVPPAPLPPKLPIVDQQKACRARKRKFRHDGSPTQCSECGTFETPEWRRGPDGNCTLCNACGLYHAKLMKAAGDESTIQKIKHRRRVKMMRKRAADP